MPFVGVLITQRHRHFAALTSVALAGRTIAFPDRRAFAATLMVKEYLRARGVIVDRDMKPRYLHNQDSVILAVARGLVDLGGTWPWSLAQEPASVRARIRILARTPPGPEMPIAVRTTLAPATVQAIRMALVDLRQSAAGRTVLRRLYIPAGFVAVRPGEYAHIPRLINPCARP